MELHNFDPIRDKAGAWNKLNNFQRQLLHTFDLVYKNEFQVFAFSSVANKWEWE